MMTAEKKTKVADMEKNENNGRCILVGLQLDANGRDLLSWTFSKEARRGDRILAVHVSRDSDVRNKSVLSVIKELNDYLAVYDGLCNLKQLVVVGRVAQGKSINRTIVKEAESCGAVAVVVGVNKNCPFGSTSLAKFCAKKLPVATALFAVDKGKVILEKPAAELKSGGDRKKKLGSILHPSIGMGPKVIIPSSEAQLESETPRTSYSSEKKASAEDHCHDRILERADSNFSSPSLSIGTLPEDAPGWPLLRCAVAANLDIQDVEARKMSVVQWVMSLPRRSSSPSSPMEQGKEERAIPNDHLSKELEEIFKANSCSCKWLQFEELQRITKKFSSDNLIGKGGNSRVYRGCLSTGQQAAIKVSKLTEETLKNFLLEANIITSLQHDRVVPLIGICLNDKSLVTIYEFFPSGSLEENLHGKGAKAPLPWDIRFKVAIGVAEALNYLHNGCPRSVIHRDIKSSNILLTDKFEPQLSDFGLAIWAPTSSSYLTHSDVVGTFGYLAPEYFMYGKLSVKMDVYAFGVLLLELLTGRKPISNETPKGQESLVMWATPILEKGNLNDLLDPSLIAKYDEDQMHRTVLAASLCIKRAAHLRPHMNQVLKLLKGEKDAEAWMRSHTNNMTKELEDQDDETYPTSSFNSHLGVALQDIGDDASVVSLGQTNVHNWEEYLKGRWSRSSSFD